jgi:hypothetical protein
MPYRASVRTTPPSLTAGAATLFHEPANEAASHRDMYVYRCMGGSVWVCNHGANISCAKGDTRRVLPCVTDYCNENPNQDFVPMVVTGHGTIHSWECVGGRARIKQSEEVDRRGFIANQWLLLSMMEKEIVGSITVASAAIAGALLGGCFLGFHTVTKKEGRDRKCIEKL